MRPQAASTKQFSGCSDTFISDWRRAKAILSTTFANSAENSTLCGVVAIHPTLPFTEASSPGREWWKATPGGRLEGEGAAIAPAAVDALNRARARRALSNAIDASRAAAFACSTSSLWRRRLASLRILVDFASLNARQARATSAFKSEGPPWAPRSWGLKGWRSVERVEPRCRRWCSVKSGESSWWRSPGAGERWRRDALESGSGCSACYLRPGESTRSVGVSGRCPLVLSLVSSLRPSSGRFSRSRDTGCEREFERDLGRSYPVS